MLLNNTSFPTSSTCLQWHCSLFLRSSFLALFNSHIFWVPLVTSPQNLHPALLAVSGCATHILHKLSVLFDHHTSVLCTKGHNFPLWQQHCFCFDCMRGQLALASLPPWKLLNGNGRYGLPLAHQVPSGGSMLSF